MSPKPDVSEDRKNQILEAATSVFTRLGVSNARMDDIVEESGLSKGTLYWYFNSKDEIIANIISKLFEPEFSDLHLITNQDISSIEKLYQVTDHMVSEIDSVMNYLPLVYEFIALAYRQDYVQEIIKTYFNQYMKNIVAIIDEGVKKYELHTPDSRQTAVHLGAIFEGTLLLWIYDPESVNIKEDIHSGMTIIINGMKTQQ